MSTNKKVLIVEDDEGFRVLLRVYLMRMGVSLYEASDGLDGYALAREIEPDLIICDLSMPRSNGIDFIKNIRSSVFDALKDCPIIVISGGTVELQRLAIDAGANTVLEKPYVSQSTIRQTVQVFLGNN